ncbi:MAG: hypothetical protein COB04_12360, partial [Gammaproteobacteria bacterium]
DEVYSSLGVKSRKQEKYKAFVEMGVDEELAKFYGKGNVSPYLGSDEFRSWAYDQRVTEDEAVNYAESIQFRPEIPEVIDKVAVIFKVSPESIRVTQRGGSNNVPRWVAMHLCQELGGQRLTDIAAAFGLKRTGSIPTTIKKLRELMEGDQKLVRKVDRVKREIAI